MVGSGYEGDSLEAVIRHLEEVTHKTGERLAESMVAHGEKAIARNTPVETRVLRESWQKTPISYGQTSQLGYTSIKWSAYAWTGHVFTEVEYAPYVEFGTGLWGPKRKKYKIAPKKPGGVLVFTPYARSPNGGVVLDVVGNVGKHGPIYVQFVMHPGSPGAHMIKIGASLTEHEYNQWSAEPMRLWKREVEGRAAGMVKVGG